MDNNKLTQKLTCAIYTLLSVTLYIYSLAVTSVNAEQKQPIVFSTPQPLTQTELSNQQAIIALLNNQTFIDALNEIALQLSDQTLSTQSSFNKMALLSARQDYQTLFKAITEDAHPISYYYYQLHGETMLAIDGQASDMQFSQQLSQSFSQKIATLSDEKLFKLSSALGWSVENAASFVTNIFKRYQKQASINEDEAIDLIVNTQIYQVISRVIPVTEQLFNQENQRRYIIEPEVIITTEQGVELAATIVRKKGVTAPRATAMQFTIYADEPWHIKTAIHAAAHGFVGVVANTRGKRSSRNDIVPWEYDGQDATSVIDWITKQPWSNGEVGMYGGSYNGFTQWAAAKHMHPALKTIVPYSAANPLTGLPLENNIYLTDNYAWAFHVTNNDTMDNSVYADWNKTNQLKRSLFESGRALVDIDKIDGIPNPWFQKWLKHPSYDQFYQEMLPYKNDYKRINIPVLSITGYFDGGQISAIDFLQQHSAHNNNAEHYLLIGPYNHGTAQGVPNSHHSNYALDAVALKKDTEEIALEWINYVVNDGAKPELIKDKVNYQLMGANSWQYHSSYVAMNQLGNDYYLTGNAANSQSLTLSKTPEKQVTFFQQTVDMRDRTEQRNRSSWPVITEQLNESNGLIFMTEPMSAPQQLAGAISGYFNIAVNKKDVDIGYNFYEITADGKAFHLNNYKGRASYANDMTTRTLLTPNQKTQVAIVNGRMTAKVINKGSRLAIVLNINKNIDAQVNLGSGKDVSLETLADAGEPMVIKWFNDSKIHLPLTPWQS